MNRQIFKYITSDSPKRCYRQFSSWTPLGSIFNNRPSQKNSLPNTDVGLFDVPELITANGFQLLKDQCKSETDALIHEAISEARTKKMVQIFDELSDNLCRVADLAEFIRLAHPSPGYTEAAEEACATVSGIVEKLNTHKKLYDALSHVVEKGDKMDTTAVDDHVAKLFQFDFEQSGIHLPETERNKVVLLNDKILHLGQRFVASALVPRTITKDTLPDSMHRYFTWDGDKVLVSGLNAESINPVARELAYRIYLYPDTNQDQILMELLAARHTLAVTCGFDTYAHRAMNGSLLANPETAMEFLNRLSELLRPRAQCDFDIMTVMKAKDSGVELPFAAWDVPYYTHRYKKDTLDVSASDYSPYFSLGSCMEGIDGLCERLFGIRLRAVEMGEGESWASDIYKLAVQHENEGLLGYIYCDFYERTGKPNQDCHFTIRGGKELSDGDYQKPIVVLSLNLPCPRWSSPTLLTPGMVDNLFHEMGHALHSMLARTKYQHVTGTRCSTDFAEVPSVLMEYFARDPRVIRMFAKHFQTKEEIPEKMLRRLCASKLIFKASEMQMQLFYSALDQSLHIEGPTDRSTTDVLARVQNEYYCLPYIQNTAWQLRFSHLVGYGAKYYSYLVSTALASWIWRSYFAADPLSRAQGERYRRECLAHGGGKPPSQLVADYLEKEPTPALLAEALIHEIDDNRARLDDFSQHRN